jgi:hypothetical protein
MADAQRNMNDNQLRLAIWLSMPERDRRPRTKKELAKALGVGDMTLWRWSKDPNVVMATRWLTLNAAGDPRRVGNILDFMYDTALDQDLSVKVRLTAARDWLKAIGVHESWSFDNKLLKIQDVEEIDLDALSDEELWDLYRERAALVGVDPIPEQIGESEVTVAEVVEDDEAQVVE